MKETGKNVRY